VTDQELADHVVEVLKDFAPAVSIQPGHDEDQVIVEIVMSRSRHPFKPSPSEQNGALTWQLNPSS
jgi:hypothetical protein